MAKFTLSNSSVFSLAAQALTCITTVTIDEAVDDIISECFGADSAKEHVLAGINGTGSFTIELENNDVTMLGYIAPKTSGAMILQPNGTTAGDIKLTSTKMQITGLTPVNVSRSGLAIASGTFVLDDLTVTTN